MLSESIGQLAHIQHGYLLIFLSAVHSERQIAQFAVSEPDKCVARSTNMCDFCHFHREVFKFWKMWIFCALRLKYILPPKTYNGEFCWFILAATIHVERHLSLHTSNRHAGSNHLPGQFRHIIPRIGKHRHYCTTEEFTGTAGMKIHLTFFQFLITIQTLTHVPMVSR